MRLTSKSQYGLLVIAELIRCYRVDPRGYTQISVLAERCGTSAKYLEQILLPLTHGAILDSKRGANGGYRLAGPPENYSLADAIRHLDGRLMPIPQWAETPKQASPSRNDATITSFGNVLLQVRDSIRNILENTSIDVLAEELATDPDAVERSKSAVETLMYYI